MHHITFVPEHKQMSAINNISIAKKTGELEINVDFIGSATLPVASILDYSGELIEEIELVYGVNKIALKHYPSKNCSIRVTNGKNVVTQKI